MRLAPIDRGKGVEMLRMAGSGLVRRMAAIVAAVLLAGGSQPALGLYREPEVSQAALGLYEGAGEAQTAVGSFQGAGGCELPAPQVLVANILGSLETQVNSESTIRSAEGQAYRQVDVGISGRLEGCTRRDGPRSTDLTDVPLLWLHHAHFDERPPQLPLRPEHSPPGPLSHGVGRFEAAAGSGITMLYAEAPAAWNGKLYVVQHGSGIYPRMGELPRREPGASFTPHASRNYFAATMIDKGYAVAWVRKDASRTGGVSRVELEDGSSVTRTFTSHAALELALTKYAQGFMEERLGRKPSRTYFYGFSGGGRTGRIMNYVPGANLDADGTRIVDGYLLDDAGGGVPFPVMFRDGQDVLLQSARDREAFAPQIDVSHALYYVDAYLPLKRENARIILEKGLGDKHRVYEVRGVSHFDAGRGRPESLDSGGLMEALIDALDQWVDGGVAPPASRADVPALASQPAIALPEVACPVGVYYQFPPGESDDRRAAQTTTLAAFDGVSPEPMDARGVLVDMNGNGARDTRESVAAAWQRLGLLGAGEALTPARYAACIEQAAAALAQDRLLPQRLVGHYRQQALQRPPGSGTK